MRKNSEVPVRQLRWRCNPQNLGFKTTREITCCEDILGQERALKAIRLGLEVKSPGYNIFIAGLTGTGKTTTIKLLLERIEPGSGIPDDICYVHNFKQPDSPRVLQLSPGRGCELAADMEALIDDLRSKLSQIFSSEGFEKQHKKIMEDLKNQSIELFQHLEAKMKKEGFAVVKVDLGYVTKPEILPVMEGDVITWEQLSERVKQGTIDQKSIKKLQQKHRVLAEDLDDAIRENRIIEKSIVKAVKTLKNKFCQPIVSSLINELKDKYHNPIVTEYLDAVQEAIQNNLERFQEREDAPQQAVLPLTMPQEQDDFHEFKINVVVDNALLKKVPVIIETAPNYKNLFGTIERVVDRQGVWRTDFTKIKAGSLLKANGGYLVLNMLDVLIEPGVWVALKRMLRHRMLDIQAYDPFHLSSGTALKPEPVQIDVKVVVIGDMNLYQMLYFYDDDFRKIFKVKADFDTVMTKNESALKNYARFVKKICDEENLLPFANTGVAEVIEYGVRLAGRQNKISSRFSDIADLIRESNYWAKGNSAKIVKGDHVRKALDEKHDRFGMLEDKIQEMIDEGVLMIDVDGMKTGQVNGLSVYELGDFSFGRPTKITAEVSMGRAGIINIEREADLSGKTHNKGVLIIAGYLRGKYAQDKPLSMSVSLAFEQSYSGVDGDSASSTEIYAVLSELSEMPLRQDIAVTGSVNQKGEIQPIGGVNQKIEGFFAVCQARGLTGNQGVMIPHQNVADLMLDMEVVEAVKHNQFHVYPVQTIEQGIEILTGVKAGKKTKKGKYPKATVNFLVEDRLVRLAKGLKEFYAEEGGKNKN